jgi:acid phosphatase family membrane protein YuiD
MESFGSFFENRVLIVAMVAWLTAQVGKVAVILVRDKQLRVRRLIGAGGMPSSHSAFTAALTIGIGLTEGFDAPVFALAAAFALVVMYDAAGVRQAAGQHARIINQIRDLLEDVIEKGQPPDEKRLKELIGHTPVEVIVGAALGIALAYVFI